MTHPDSHTPGDQALTTTQPIADVLLASPPSTTSDEDLTAALSAPPPSARSRRLTLMLVAATLLVLGFVGGVWAQQQWGADQPAAGPGGAPGSAPGQARGAQPGGLPSGFPDGTGQPGTAGQAEGGGTASDTTTGEVTLVDGDVIYLTTPSGEQVRVEVEDATSISIDKDADLSDVEEGDTVTVTGTTGDSGLAATSVEVDR